MPTYPAPINTSTNVVVAIRGKAGPYLVGSNRYVFMDDQTAGKVVIYKSTDAGYTWTPMDSGNAPTYSFSGGATGGGWAEQDALNGNHLWVAVDIDPNASTTANQKIYRFDASTDLWDNTGTTGGTLTGLSHPHLLAFHCRSDSTIAALIEYVKTGSKGTVAWVTAAYGAASWSAFSELDGFGAGSLKSPGQNFPPCFAATGDDAYAVVNVQGDAITDPNNGISCFAADPPEYKVIFDIRTYRKTLAAESGSNDGCLMIGWRGFSAIGETGVQNRMYPNSMVFVASKFWASASRERFGADQVWLGNGDSTFPSDNWTKFTVTGFDQVLFGNEYPGTSYVYMGFRDTGPVAIWADTGSSMAFSKYESGAWTAPTNANFEFPNLVQGGNLLSATGAPISILPTVSGSVGLVAGNRYWEDKFTGVLNVVQSTSVVTARTVNGANVTAGGKQPDTGNNWSHN